MKILLAEYAVGTGLDGTLLLEGKAMLRTLANSFHRLGHEVTYLSAGSILEQGTAVDSNMDDFESVLERTASDSDAGLVIGPDELLEGLSRIIEENTANLGCSPESVRMCADKLECTEILHSNSINAPRIVNGCQDGSFVIKPRYGCAAEDIIISSTAEHREGFIATEYIEGEHLSMSIIAGNYPLPLSVNKQFIEIDGTKPGSCIDYKGNIVPYRTENETELFDIAIETVRALKCNGYTGIDIVRGDKTYVVDVNPRPTTAIFGLARTMRYEIGQLLLENLSGELPDKICIEGECSFTKDDIEDMI
ncbi:ATP-grasp domain-containing protein [Methanolobus sp. ZRKC3]|uniref:ATP-grasp domain-containing protein n=1 Tax=Methanolobus sp. ZRKC3 TaxID=3125786 RepID=UPI003250A9DC